MRVSTFILSVFGCCVFYICNADWIDDLLEDYLGGDYEEIAPFVSSVTAGTEEFDRLAEELTRWRLRRILPSPFVLLAALCAAAFSVLLYLQTFEGGPIARAWVRVASAIRKSESEKKEEMQTAVAELLERKLKRLCGCREGEEVPVKLLWKGGNLVESSVHCGVRTESKLQHVQRHLLQSQLLFNDGSGDETLTLVPTASESSTAEKMAEIRKLLESEQELGRREEGTEKEEEGGGGSAERCRGGRRKRWKEEAEEEEKEEREKRRECGREEAEGGGPDQKLMSRIRLLESRLRLEELKNKNWISRMSRAEGILQQLNKQVERIEEARPVGTLTETLKITSTVTNWARPPSPPTPHAPPTPPRRNPHFTMVSQYQPFSAHAPYTSLSELIRKEIGLPSTDDLSRSLRQLPPAPPMPALSGPSPPSSVQPSSFLTKFLCR